MYWKQQWQEYRDKNGNWPMANVEEALTKLTTCQKEDGDIKSSLNIQIIDNYTAVLWPIIDSI